MQDDYRKKDILLFQVDWDEKIGIMWGHSGVGHFFINEEDLTNKNFNTYSLLGSVIN